MLEIKRYDPFGQDWEIIGDGDGDYVLYEDYLAVVEKLKAQIEVARAEGACEGQHLGFKIGYEDGYSKGFEEGRWINEWAEAAKDLHESQEN